MAQNTQNNVLVVGGSSGVGLAAAKLALTGLPGTNIVISSSTEEKLKKAVEDIKSTSGAKSGIVDYVVGDISNFDSQYDDVEAILKKSVDIFGGKIDHVVWTAGNFPGSNSGERNHQDIIGVASTRIFGPLTLGQLAPHYMNESQHSSITITSGVRIYKPTKGRGRLAAAGGSIEAGAKGLAVDLAPIRVNFVVLGIIQTPLVDTFTQGNDQMLEAFKEQTLLKAIGKAEEAAEAYLFSMRCAYMTASRIDVEGGMLLA